MQGVGCRVQGAGCRVQGAGCRVHGTCSRMGRASNESSSYDHGGACFGRISPSWYIRTQGYEAPKVRDKVMRRPKLIRGQGYEAPKVDSLELQTSRRRKSTAALPSGASAPLGVGILFYEKTIWIKTFLTMKISTQHVLY